MQTKVPIVHMETVTKVIPGNEYIKYAKYKKGIIKAKLTKFHVTQSEE